jgi:hypothetical protein
MMMHNKKLLLACRTIFRDTLIMRCNRPSIVKKLRMTFGRRPNCSRVLLVLLVVRMPARLTCLIFAVEICSTNAILHFQRLSSASNASLANVLLAVAVVVVVEPGPPYWETWPCWLVPKRPTKHISNKYTTTCWSGVPGLDNALLPSSGSSRRTLGALVNGFPPQVYGSSSIIAQQTVQQEHWTSASSPTRQ